MSFPKNLSKKKLAAVLGAGVVATGFGLGVVADQAFAVDELRTDSRAVGLGGAAAARVELEVGIGDLTVGGGGSPGGLLDADFTYNVDDWAPEADYRIEGAEGSLKLRQPDGHQPVPFRWWQDAENKWDVRLNDAVPTDLRVTLGVGESALRLGGLNLTGLDIEAGIGETEVDLYGAWSRDLDARIESGVGEVTVTLPKDVGVWVEADQGLGDVDAEGLTRAGDAYVNAAYGQSPVTLRLEVDGGVGEINLEVAE